jgi:hypothetical protein
MSNSNKTQDYIPASDDPPVRTGIYLAEVKSFLDPTFMGIMHVRLLHAVGNDNYAGQLLPVKYMSPFYGSTSVNYTTSTNDYNNSQKSYGMWMIPPDVGTTVMVLFVKGDPKYGYWLGSVLDEGINFMLPGLAATKFVEGGEGRLPTAEYNKSAVGAVTDPTKAKKAVHPFAKILKEQGLVLDDARGITTSSARRDSPSAVFGISTPGPIDKQPNAKQGKVGPDDKPQVVPVSRLGGATFVMDDGDDKFIRKTKADMGPPEYVSVEQKGLAGGDVTIPHNELIRLRTRTGHQILLHNSEDLIYIGNAKGTTWIELTSNGKIDIFAEDSISIHSKTDINMHADRDINMHAGREFNVKSDNKMQLESVGNLSLYTASNTVITSVKDSYIKSGGAHVETAAGKIYMNSKGKVAVAATALKTNKLPDQTGMTTAIESIAMRVPTMEPWPHHENLDPLRFTKDKTDRTGQSLSFTPDKWKKYSTDTDTFEKIVRADTTKRNTL